MAEVQISNAQLKEVLLEIFGERPETFKQIIREVLKEEAEKEEIDEQIKDSVKKSFSKYDKVFKNLA